MSERVELVIYGPPRTKKNHGRRVWAPKQQRAVHVPSEAYEAWCAVALMQIPKSLRLPDQPYNCRALIYRTRSAGDAVGYYQAIADMLQAAGVVSDDKWIVSWDGSRLRKDARNPRVELVIETVEETQVAA